MKIKPVKWCYSLMLLASGAASAVEDAIELETTRIITNEELPGLIYMVPWKDVEAARVDSQKLVLHDFFGDLYDPVLPNAAEFE